MSEKPVNDIALTFAEQSVSAALNRLYAARYKKEGKGFISKLLKAIADSEEVQTRRIRMHLRGKIGDPDEYLQDLMKRKYEDYGRLLPAISAELYQKGKKTAAEAFEQFGEVAKIHYDMLTAAIRQESDNPKTYLICQVCGYIAVDDPPSKCPICGAVTAKFKMEE
ncbi:MAG: rubrerythrin family protein [Deltaproteobacteria bacterium]|nr:MAG: rubrerythrin family protein [Deltaproteobacteria bacterium]